VKTYDLKLVAGRNFTADEINSFQRNDTLQPPVVLMTQQLAKKVFPDGDAVGKQVYLSENATPSTIVGVVERLQTPWVGRWADEFWENSTIVPLHYMGRGTALRAARRARAAATRS
jgi:putative ABC transport system permease protein